MAFSENLVWMDLEMTGLDPERDRIIEIATVITNSDLEIVAQCPSIVVRQSEELLAGMDEWNTEHHSKTGLIDEVRRIGVEEAEAEARSLAFVSEHVDPLTSPLCGNTIWQDRRFLVKYMPELEAHLHYRNIDVSTIKELAARWRPEVYNAVRKEGAHRAMDDIKESIEELKVYRRSFFC